MLSNLESFIIIAKYILIGLAAIGVITLGVGVYQRQQTLTIRGAYMLILAIVFAICGYFIYGATVKRTYEILDNTYIEYK